MLHRQPNLGLCGDFMLYNKRKTNKKRSTTMAYDRKGIAEKIIWELQAIAFANLDRNPHVKVNQKLIALKALIELLGLKDVADATPSWVRPEEEPELPIHEREWFKRLEAEQAAKAASAAPITPDSEMPEPPVGTPKISLDPKPDEPQYYTQSPVGRGAHTAPLDPAPTVPLNREQRRRMEKIRKKE